jgi:hypothetical protein
VKTIWKFPLRHGVNSVPVTADHRVVHVGVDTLDPTMPCVWIELGIGELFDAPQPTTSITVQFYGTGHDIPDEATYLGTCVTTVGLVWHVYQL